MDDQENSTSKAEKTPIQRLSERFKALSPGARIGLIAAIPALIAIFVAALLWAQKPDMRVLFSGLADKDGGTIIAALNQMQVPHEIGAGGTTILVPGHQVHEIRLKLAQQGLPKGSTVGFETFDTPRYGMTQAQEQAHFQRALEGELARSIQSMSAVQSARVHLAIPKPTLFVREIQKPTASVMLTLLNGRSLDRTQLDGIVHLVASSVPDLPPKNVSIVDQHGSLLTNNGSGSERALDAQQLGWRNAMEDQFRRRIVEILTPVVGSENVRAQVTLDLDFSEIEQTSETYKPNQQPNTASVRSQQNSEQTQTGGGGASGIPGSLTNQPPGAAQAPINPTAPGQPQTNDTRTQNGQNNGPSSARKDQTINYELDKTVQHAKMPTGSIKRLSAAIVINHKPSTGKPKKGQEPGTIDLEPLSADEVQRITALAKEAVGFSDKRGDTMNVVNAPFTKAPAPEALPLWQDPQLISMAGQIGKWLVVLTLGALIVFGVIKPLLKQMQTPTEAVGPNLGLRTETAPAGAGNVTFSELEDNAEDANDPNKPPSPLEIAKKMAREEPKVSANVVRNWINGGEAT